MAVSLKHNFASGIADDPVAQAAGEVLPSHWNAEHDLTLGTDRLLGRDTAGSGSAEEIGLGASLEFSGSGTIQRAALTGDVTAAANGNATTIADNAVTYAKMQDVTATSRILGRKTAGAGDPEECTLSEILDFIGSAAQGDILYRGAAGWARLAAGTSGHYLQTQGAAANPQWAAVAAGAAPFDDGTAIVKGSADATKLLRFEVDGFTTATTRVLTPPNADGTIAVLSLAQTWTAAQYFNIGTESLPGVAFEISGNHAYGMFYTGGVLGFSVNGTRHLGLQAGLATLGTSSQAVGLTWDASQPAVLYGHKRQRYDLASSTTLTSGSYNGSTLTNSTATAAITSTLASAAQGWHHRMVDDNATYRWTIKPNTGDTIIWTDGTVVTNATGSIVSTGRYCAVDLETLDTTVWLARNVRGAWTVTA